MEASSALRAVGWILAFWFLVSVAAAVIITRLFRARARRNDQLAADGRRAEWKDAASDAPDETLARR